MATLVKRNYRTFDNLFDELFSNLPATVGKELGWNNPPVNIHENNDGFHLELVAPGLKKEDFKINLDKDILSISVEKKADAAEEGKKYSKREYSYKSFVRSFTLPDSVDYSKIEAEYTDGILKLSVAKKEEAKIQSKEIAVK